jgi:hypothetical protein
MEAGRMPDTLPEGAREALRRDSDELMDALQEVKRLEATKRAEPITSDRFHEQAKAVEKQARRVLGLAMLEESDGRAARQEEERRLGKPLPPDGGGNPAIEDPPAR